MSLFVSAVIITHKRPAYVSRAIESALNQTYKNIEIVLVSDGRDPETDNVVKKYLENCSHLHYFSYEEPKGANYARNYGASKAHGEILAFLDDDDSWHPDKVEKQMAIFEKDSSIGLVTSGFRFIYVTNNSEATYVPSPKYDCSKEILQKNVIGGTPGVMIKKEVFDQAGGFDVQLKALQDYDLWVRAAQITKVGVVKETCTDCFDFFDPNKISNSTSRYIEAYNLIENKYCSLFSNLSKKENRIRKYNFSILLSKKGLRNNDRKITRRYAKKALGYHFNFLPLSLVVLSLFPYSFVLKIKNKIFR